MRRRMLPLAAGCLFVALGLAPSYADAQDQPDSESGTEQVPAATGAEPLPEAGVADLGDRSTVRERLDAVRDDLVELRFEQALAALEALLGAASLDGEERIEAWVLRSQTHAAFGAFEAAEEDYREILLQRPAWRPDESLIPKKAMTRFAAVRDALIGRVLFVLDPADATLWVDGREIAGSVDPIPFPAGSYSIRVARRGYDAHEGLFEVQAGKSLDLELSLVPNARTVVVRTEPDDVEVRVDGMLVGSTSRTDPFVGIGSPSAELVLEDLPLGEHRFELSKPCYRSERFSDALNVDLLDRSAKRYDTVHLAESYAAFAPRGGPEGALLRVDGAEVATLPVESVRACPGERELEVTYAGRILWRERRTLNEGSPLRLTIEPRPNLFLVGVDRLPAELADLALTMNVLPGPASPPGLDLSLPESWERLQLDRQADLALAPVSGGRRGSARGWWLHSPILRTVERIEQLPDSAQPAWEKALWGVQTVDADGPLVVTVSPTIVAESLGVTVGSRIVSVDGRAVAQLSDLNAALSAAEPNGSAKVAWKKVDGTAVEGVWVSSLSPWLRDRVAGAVPDAFRVAWALAVAESRSAQATPALANLALIFGRYGEHELAVLTWKRVRWSDPTGIGSGTVAYYLGRELQALGRDREAIEALGVAAASKSTVATDAGAPVAPAARDRLADLGEAP